MQTITIFLPQAMPVSDRLLGCPVMPVLPESCLWQCWRMFQHCWPAQFSSHHACLFACTVSDGLVRHPFHCSCPRQSDLGIERPIVRQRHFFNGWLLQPRRSNWMISSTTTAARNPIGPSTTNYTSCADTAVLCCISRQQWHSEQPKRTCIPCSLQHVRMDKFCYLCWDLLVSIDKEWYKGQN